MQAVCVFWTTEHFARTKFYWKPSSMNAFDSLTGSDNMHTIAFCSAQIFYMGVAIYAPSVALQACKCTRTVRNEMSSCAQGSLCGCIRPRVVNVRF